MVNLLPAALGAGAGLLSFVGGERRNRSQERMAERQMDFQETMSNTAYQRAMKDMSQAGLNPILAGKLGGASTPQGGQPVLHDTITPALNSAMNVTRTQADNNLKAAQTALNSAQATLKSHDIPGQEIVSTVTTEVAELAKSIRDLGKEYVPDYKPVIESLQNTITQLIEKASNAGHNTTVIIKELKNQLGDEYSEVKEFIDDTGASINKYFNNRN